MHLSSPLLVNLVFGFYSTVASLSPRSQETSIARPHNLDLHNDQVPLIPPEIETNGIPRSKDCVNITFPGAVIEGQWVCQGM